MWSQFTNVTDRRRDVRTDRQTTCDGNTALCTKVHRAVKTKEIVFRRQNPRLSHFVDHVSAVLKVCSQRMYLMKFLRAQGLPVTQLNTVFQALILNKIRYAIPAWSGFLSLRLVSQINGLLKRCYKYGYCLKINTLEELIESANYKLFRSLQNPQHCLHSILPPTKHLTMTSDPKGTTIRSPTTPQSCINDLSSPILCSSITDFSS